MMNNITFFTKGTKTKKLTVGDENRRTLIITLLESRELLSPKKLSAKSQIPYSTTHVELEKFVTSGLVRPHDAGTYKRIQHARFELTNGGTLFALAVKYDKNLPMGEHVKDTLIRVLQPESGTAPINYFMQNVLINALSRDMVDYVLRFIRDLVQEMEFSQEPDLWKMAARGISQAKPSEADRLGSAVIQTLNNCSDVEKNTLIQFFKTNFLTQLSLRSVLHNNSKQQALFVLSQESKDGIFIDFTCGKCPYKNEQMPVNIENVIIKVFTSGWRCPRCKRLVSDLQKDRKGFRYQKNLPLPK